MSIRRFLLFSLALAFTVLAGISTLILYRKATFEPIYVYCDGYHEFDSKGFQTISVFKASRTINPDHRYKITVWNPGFEVAFEMFEASCREDTLMEGDYSSAFISDLLAAFPKAQVMELSTGEVALEKRVNVVTFYEKSRRSP